MKKVLTLWAIICLSTLIFAGSLYATVVGDVNNDGKIDLTETIYSLRILAGTANPLIPTNEIEPNNSIDEASPIELDNPVTGNIATNDDSDFYRLYVPQEGILDIYATSVPDNIDMEIRLYDNNKTRIATFGRGNLGQSRIHDIQLVEGTYYLQLYDAFSNASSPNHYEIEIELDRTDIHEVNSSFDKSASIDIGETIKGSLRPVGDEDFYSFQIPQEGVLDIQATSISDNIDMEMQLYDINKTRIATFGRGNPGQSRIHAIQLMEGTYYLQLYDAFSNASNRNLYDLRLELDTTDIYEINGSLDQASLVNIGDTINGSIRPIGDSDFFIFQVSQAGTLNISITSVPDNIDMEMNLYDETRTRVQTFSRGNAGQSRIFDYSVEPGTYYLQLYDAFSNASSFDRYELRLTITP